MRLNGKSRYDVTPLRNARDEQGLSNTIIATATGIDQSVISRTLNGHYGSPRTVKRIADFLRVPMTDLRPADEEAVA